MRTLITHGLWSRWAVEKRSQGSGLSLVWLVWDGCYWVERYRTPGEFYDDGCSARMSAAKAARALGRRFRSALQ